MLPFPEVRDLADDVRRMFEELELAGGGVRGLAGEYTPPLDVFETRNGAEIRIDLPGVPPQSIRVLIKSSTVIVAGQKLALECCPPGKAAFHLVERGFGRFARGVRLNGAFDASRANATLRRGELILTIPRIEERRGREIPVRVEPEQ